jgi:hypothetical protein
MSTLNRQIETLLTRQEAALRRAFLMAIQDLRGQAQLTQLRNALRAGDIEAAIRALNIDSAAYATFAREIGNTYTQAGATIAAGTVWRLPDQSRAVIRFNVTNPRAERFLSEVSSQKITRITQDTIAAARLTINAGYAGGMHPNRIALDLVGRIGANGRRTGGIIGLSEPQARLVADMRSALSSDGPVGYARRPDGTLARKFWVKRDGTLGSVYERRDSRFDRTILKSLESGKPLNADMQDRIVGRFSDRQLQLRGEAIARTETGMATESARHEAWAQYRDQTGIPDEAIVKRWVSAGPASGGNERATHQEMNTVEVRGINTPFVLSDGSTLQYPLDPAASVENLVNCRCGYSIFVDWAMLAR